MKLIILHENQEKKLILFKLHSFVLIFRKHASPLSVWPLRIHNEGLRFFQGQVEKTITSKRAVN